MDGSVNIKAVEHALAVKEAVASTRLDSQHLQTYTEDDLK